MTIVSWNIRGVGRKGFLAHLKHLLSSYAPDIIALMENRVRIKHGILSPKSIFLILLRFRRKAIWVGFGCSGRIT